jgi:GNAT superfamily N-acetyltransferase
MTHTTFPAAPALPARPAIPAVPAIRTTRRLAAGGSTLTVRPVEAGDAERLGRMFHRLSRESVLFRFLSPVHRLTTATLEHFADVDHASREALVALDGDEIVAVARYDRLPPRAGDTGRRAEIALTVEDAWQHRGVGPRLVRRLGSLARSRGYDTFVATILPENRAALGLVHRLAPGAGVTFVGGHYEARIPLR